MNVSPWAALPSTVLASRMAWPVAALLVAIVATLAPAPLSAGKPSVASAPSGIVAAPAAVVSVMFSARSGEEAVARSAIEAVGGRLTRKLGIINAHVAAVPRDQLARLTQSSAFAWITPDSAVTLSAKRTSDTASTTTSLAQLAETVGADDLWQQGLFGTGVDIAMIDSGVVPVNGLTRTGKVINGPDLSFESGNATVRYLDTFGHGTHMAGIIAGNDDSYAKKGRKKPQERFIGVAPGARIVNVKVANAWGATDVSQVIAAIDWVVQHRRSNGLNIRVLNLSFGTDGVQDHRLDPLSHAVEQAWHHGLVVVTAAGNQRYGDDQLNNPAYNPYVLAVGATDSHGTVGPEDDTVTEWSSRGDARRHPDLVAPGKSIVSLRDPRSYIDLQNPDARVGKRFFRGSGTSQAAAVVSGAAALLLEQRPQLTPDQVKALLTSSARPLGQAPEAEGAGLIDLQRAAGAPTPSTVQTWPRSTGVGSLQLARGSHHVTLNDVPLTGEQSVFGTAWDGYAWTTASAAGVAWAGGSWTGNSWTGNSWTGGSWTGNSWTGNSWTGNSWTGNSWTGNSWTGNSWTGNSWTGNSWTGNSWTGNSWTGNSWTGNSWTSAGW